MLRYAVVSVVLLVTAYWCAAYFLQRSMLFQPPPAADRPQPPDLVEVVWFDRSAGRVELWWLPPDIPPDMRSAPGLDRPDDNAAQARQAAPLVIFAHGNGELIDHWVEAFRAAQRSGLGVLLVEYPGYGRSEGEPSESTIRVAMVDAYDWAVRQQAVDASRVVAHGRSVGGGAALLLAEQRPVAALVLESTFTSVVDIARSRGVPALLIRDPFNNRARIASYEGPVLLLHGARDSQIPPDHSRRLREAAGGTATLELLPCGHNDCPTAWPHVLPFLRAHGILQKHAVGGH